jgi:hypothetical protein
MRFRNIDPEEFNELTGLQALKAKCFMADLAAEIDLTPAALKKWTDVPAELVVRLSDLTGIAPHVLRPDLYADYKPAARSATSPVMGVEK